MTKLKDNDNYISYTAIAIVLVLAIAFGYYSIILNQKYKSDIDKFISANNEKKENIIQDTYFSSYMRTMQKNIKANWHPPKDVQSKRVVVIFTISKHGKLLKYNILTSSGNDKMDSAAIEALKKTKFEPLPNAYTKNSVDVQFTFDYNVFSTETNK